MNPTMNVYVNSHSSQEVWTSILCLQHKHIQHSSSRQWGKRKKQLQDTFLITNKFSLLNRNKRYAISREIILGNYRGSEVTKWKWEIRGSFKAHLARLLVNNRNSFVNNTRKLVTTCWVSFNSVRIVRHRITKMDLREHTDAMLS